MLHKQCSRCGEIKHRNNFNQCLEHKDGLAHWCRQCDARRHPHAPQRPFVETARENDCHVCKRALRFDTDREGRLLKLCGCGVSYVELRVAPPLDRKHSGKRLGR